MPIPTDRTFLESHEWHKTDGDTVTVGITSIAVEQLTAGDPEGLTYLDLPKVGKKVTAGGVFGLIESVKASSELYSGIDGEVVAVNDSLPSSLSLVYSDPFEKGWMIKIKPSTPGQAGKLLSAADYESRSGH